jgi:hypothetical protein
MSATPIGLSNIQIREMLALITAEMEEYLGYEVTVVDRSKQGEDVCPRIYGIADEDFNDKTREKFDAVCFEKLCQVAKINGE